MSLFEVKPYDREVYEKELKDFLPQKILDVHTHVYLKEFSPPKPLAPGEVKRTVTWPSLVAADDSIEDLQETYRLMLPGSRGERSVKRLLSERGIPPEKRETLPVFCVDGVLAAVWGVGVDRRFLPEDSGQGIYYIIRENYGG